MEATPVSAQPSFGFLPISFLLKALEEGESRDLSFQVCIPDPVSK